MGKHVDLMRQGLCLLGNYWSYFRTSQSAKNGERCRHAEIRFLCSLGKVLTLVYFGLSDGSSERGTDGVIGMPFTHVMLVQLYCKNRRAHTHAHTHAHTLSLCLSVSLSLSHTHTHTDTHTHTLTHNTLTHNTHTLTHNTLTHNTHTKLNATP